MSTANQTAKQEDNTDSVFKPATLKNKHTEKRLAIAYEDK